MRREAAEAIGDLAHPPATEALIALALELDDPSEAIRREAVETLGDLPGDEGHLALRRIAKRHRDPIVRNEARETLDEMAARRLKVNR